MSSENAWDDIYVLGCGEGGAGFQPSGKLETCPMAGADVVGSKAANLIRMAEAGLPVPPAFVLPIAQCRAYLQRSKGLPTDFAGRVAPAVKQIEKATGLTFSGGRRPLLVSVRSGAAVSMPGMMATILNVGLGERTLPALIRLTGNPRHAWDSYRRLVQTYAEVVHDLPADPFERRLAEQSQREGVPAADELDAAALKELTCEYLALFESQTGRPFPQEPLAQLTGAIEAVFRSWQSPRAIEYRRMHSLNDLAGTAVTVQAMVYGNMGRTSGSGVAFSRNPTTGENLLYLDYLANAQGEDVVSGRYPLQDSSSLQQTMPELYRQLRKIGRQLEKLFRDAQDFEFTVQEGHLHLLQSRRAKRTPWAALRIACELVQEGLIDEATALKHLADRDLDAIENVRLASPSEPPLCTGVPASAGVAVGTIAFDSETAVRSAAAGQPALLLRTEIATTDIAGLAAAAGVLTSRGGRTSHAAVVARQLNKVCIVGCRELDIDTERRSCRLGSRWFHEGDMLTLDGQSGAVYAGRLDVVTEKPLIYLREINRWKALLAEKPAPARVS
ncbi:MAG TPA: pyruvate, phosphate dikinase [Gemmataceae bacterium]